MESQLQGWHPDPFGRHEARYFSAGRPTQLVRNGVQESSDPVDDLPLPAQPRAAVAVAAVPPVHPAWPPAWPQPPAPAQPGRAPRWPLALAAGLAIVLLGAVGWFFPGRGRHHAATSQTTAAPRTGSGVAYTSTNGLFRARFPARPVEHSVPGSLSTMSFTLDIAACTAQRTEVASETTSVPVPSDAFDAELQTAVRSFAASADLDTLGSKALRYRGHAAREATYSMRSGAHLSLIVLAYSRTRLYLISAPSGPAFDALAASFEPLR